MIKDNIKIIKDFFYLVKGHKKWTFLLFFASIMAHLTSLLIPVFAANIIYEVTIKNALATYTNIALLALTYIIYNLFWYLNYVSYSYNFKYSYKNLREKIIDKIFTYDNEFSDKLSKGTILNTVSGDVSNLSGMIDNICEIIVVFIKVIILTLIFLNTNILIGLIVLLLELIYLKSYDYCNIKSTKYLRGQYKYRDHLTDNLNQILNGLSEIKVFNIFDKIKNNFYIIANKWSDQYMKKRKYINIRATLLPFIVHIGKIILYTILVFFVLNGTYEVNILVLLITYFENIMSNTDELMSYSRQLREWSLSITRINNLLNYTSNQQIEFGLNENDYINGLVKFKNVSFSYKSKNKGNIEKISFTALPNKITALVGHSGSGKTTITDLLLRKYKVDSGEILIDNENIYEFSNKVYSTNVVGVNQTPFIFNMSIRKNLSLIDPNIDNQIEACKRVGLHDYIMSLPKGYNTILSENANNFSGGQKQLLAIARTLLSKAEIIIFDEVTSSLDTILVEKIKEIFENLKLDHTIIIVTHKKDIMQNADKIIVLNQGKIVGQGTHKQLMKDNNYYIDIQTNNYSSSNKNVNNNIIINETIQEEKDA
ncbi:MAG: ABC transporter ATP-binding protein [Firmicutes bacterium]|nr:ABC transporter ATP-binding protein [Bacillota bacterium]